MNKDRPLTALALSVLLIGAGVTVSIAPVAAQSSGDDLISVDFDEQRPDGVLGTASAALDGAKGLLGRVSPTNMVRDITGNEPEPSEETDQLQKTLNSNEGEFVSHTNTVIDEYNASVGDGEYVLELTAESSESGETSTIYFIGQGNGTYVTGYDVVNSTSKSVDRSRTMSEFEVESLNEDVREYHEDYVQPGEVPEKGFYIKLAGKYGDVSEINITG